jgi:hypothetical protein
MKDLHALLAAADPVRETPELSAEEAQAIRRVVVAAAHAETVEARLWPGAIPMVAVVVIMIAVGIVAGRMIGPPDEPMEVAVGGLVQPSERTQVQFATPGGTRIIWTLDPEFELQGSTP